MKEFEGKTAVITGAASGIGKALAKRFAQENMQVVLADIEEDVLEKTVEELRQYQHRVIGIKTDVLIEESVQELFIKAKEEYVVALYNKFNESDNFFRREGYTNYNDIDNNKIMNGGLIIGASVILISLIYLIKN